MVNNYLLIVDCFWLKIIFFLWVDNVKVFVWCVLKYFGWDCCYNNVMVFEKEKDERGDFLKIIIYV